MMKLENHSLPLWKLEIEVKSFTCYAVGFLRSWWLMLGRLFQQFEGSFWFWRIPYLGTGQEGWLQETSSLAGALFDEIAAHLKQITHFSNYRQHQQAIQDPSITASIRLAYHLMTENVWARINYLTRHVLFIWPSFFASSSYHVRYKKHLACLYTIVGWGGGGGELLI